MNISTLLGNLKSRLLRLRRATEPLAPEPAQACTPHTFTVTRDRTAPSNEAFYASLNESTRIAFERFNKLCALAEAQDDVRLRAALLAHAERDLEVLQQWITNRRNDFVTTQIMEIE